MSSIQKTASFGIASAILCASPLCAGLATDAPIDPTVPAGDAAIPDWVPTLQLGYLHQFDTDIDKQGSFSVNRANLRVGVSRIFDRERIVGLSLGYGYDGYDFSSLATDPWSDIHTLRLGMPIRWALADSWSLFAIPTIRSSGECGASFSDSLSGGALAGVTYQFGDHLTIGPGIAVLSQIEDDANVFPILLIQWNITDCLQLETGRGFGASQGPGLNLNWQATDKWKFSLGARYEKSRFRLDDKGPSPDGVGEEKGIPVYLGASYATSKFSELSIYAGAKFDGSIALEDNTGRTLSKRDHDVAPFAGISWKLGF